MIGSTDYVKSYTLFSSYVSHDVVDLVYKIADMDDERAISALRILDMLETAYEAATTDQDPDWFTYVKTLPRVGSAEPKTTAKTWKALVAWRQRNDSVMCDRYYSRADNGKTVILNSYYDNACDRIEAGKVLSNELAELKKTMGKAPVQSKVPAHNTMNPQQKEMRLKYLNSRVGGVTTKVKTAIRVAHHLVDLKELLPDITVTFDKLASGDLSPNATPVIIEYAKSRANWDVMTVGSFLRLDPREAFKNLAQFDGNQWAALKDTLSREVADDALLTVEAKADMGVEVADKVVFILGNWLNIATNRTNLNKMKNEKETGIVTRHQIARLILNLRRVMTDKEYQVAIEEIAKLEEESDTRILAGGSKS